MIFGNVDTVFFHHFNYEGIERLGFKSGAFRYELVAAQDVKKCFCHLASPTIVPANKENSTFTQDYFLQVPGLSRHNGYDQSARSVGMRMFFDQSDNLEPVMVLLYRIDTSA